RSTVCACERSSESNLAMAIELFNGPLVHERLRDPNNRFRKALAAGASSDAVLDELYLAALCRLPNEAERAAAVAHLKKREDAAAGFEDICWAIINTDEFLFQH
ncbi:MAG: S-layer protein, partial [Pirellulales bacterium]